jgi:hypothetical protein
VAVFWLSLPRTVGLLTLLTTSNAATVASVGVDAMAVAKTPFDPEAVLQAIA